MTRYWVNQPSTLNPHHKYHGLLVIGPKTFPADQGSVTVYPATGDAYSMQIMPIALTPGWPAHLMRSEPRAEEGRDV